MVQNNSKAYDVLVTGATGFIGSYLVRELAKSGKTVVAVDRNPNMVRIEKFSDYQDFSDNVRFVEADLINLPTIQEVFDRYRPKVVFHLGALLSAGAEASPQLGYQIDLGGTHNVLECARLFGGGGAERIKVIFASTIAAFGAHLQDGAPDLGIVNKKMLVPNEAVQMPTTMYGVGKVCSERLGEYYVRKNWVDFRALRFPSVVGAARGPGGTTVYSTLMFELAAQGKPYDAYVEENTRLAILYVKDAVQALIQLAAADETRFGSSDPQGMSAKEAMLSTRVFNLTGVAVDVNGIAQPPTAGDLRQAIQASIPGAALTFTPEPKLIEKLNGFGFLDERRAFKEWEWKAQYATLKEVVEDFKAEVLAHPGRITRLELN